MRESKSVVDHSLRGTFKLCIEGVPHRVDKSLELTESFSWQVEVCYSFSAGEKVWRIRSGVARDYPGIPRA